MPPHRPSFTPPLGPHRPSFAGPPESIAVAQRLISERCREIEIQISRSAASNGFNSAPAPANAFGPPPFGYEGGQQLGYMHGMPGYGASQFNNGPGFGGAAQQQYGYACQPPAAGSTPW